MFPHYALQSQSLLNVEFYIAWIPFTTVHQSAFVSLSTTFCWYTHRNSELLGPCGWSNSINSLWQIGMLQFREAKGLSKTNTQLKTELWTALSLSDYLPRVSSIAYNRQFFFFMLVWGDILWCFGNHILPFSPKPFPPSLCPFTLFSFSWPHQQRLQTSAALAGT